MLKFLRCSLGRLAGRFNGGSLANAWKLLTSCLNFACQLPINGTSFLIDLFCFDKFFICLFHFEHWEIIKPKHFLRALEENHLVYRVFLLRTYILFLGAIFLFCSCSFVIPLILCRLVLIGAFILFAMLLNATKKVPS